MKFKKKIDVFGIVVPVAMGVLTAMIYKVGKLGGKAQAYGDCADMLQELITCDVENEVK